MSDGKTNTQLSVLEQPQHSHQLVPGALCDMTEGCFFLAHAENFFSMCLVPSFIS